jgi:hypothetical protein
MIRKSTFRPAWWLPSPHGQTLWPAYVRREPSVIRVPERITTPDGDFLDLEWTPGGDGPVVLVLHGLEGSAESHYARGMLAALDARGFRPVLMHFRNCSGEPNRARISYTGGETGDLDWLVRELGRRFPGLSLGVVGFSLGANVVLKWLGEQGAGAPVQAAAGVSPPFELGKAAWRLEQGMSRLYGRYLLKAAKASYAAKFRHRTDAPVPMAGLGMLKTFRQFDERITAPLHGYAGAEDYYRRASSRPFLPAIRVPTRVLHARDDPFTTPDAIPGPHEVPDALSLEVSDQGGHVGFVAGPHPARPRYWAEEAVVAHLAAELTP